MGHQLPVHALGLRAQAGRHHQRPHPGPHHPRRAGRHRGGHRQEPADDGERRDPLAWHPAAGHAVGGRHGGRHAVPHPPGRRLRVQVRGGPAGHLHVPRALRHAALRRAQRHDRRRGRAGQRRRRAVRVRRRRARGPPQRLVAQEHLRAGRGARRRPHRVGRRAPVAAHQRARQVQLLGHGAGRRLQRDAPRVRGAGVRRGARQDVPLPHRQRHTSLSALNFEIEGHEMTVVETDGHYVKPFVVKNLNIYSGETYSVLIKADQDPNRNYWLASNVVSRKPGTPTGTAVLSYYGGRSSPRAPPPTAPPAGPAWNDSAYRIRQSLATVAHPEHAHPPPPRADRTILLLNSQNKIDGRIKWAINNVSFTLPHTPYLVALKHGLLGAFDQCPPPETYNHTGYDVYGVQANPNATTSDGLYRLAFGSVVDVVLQNANMLAPNNSETHPWHLHGHDFWTLGYGVGRFDPAVHPATYNLRDPVMKNTVAVHPFGWTALRFRADNPGVWAFHCHIEAHFFMGMGVAFEEGIERVGDLPEEIRRCVSTKGGHH
uniref:L-ascorbate oxidase n=1 Tax=Aegilops tauschii subsp. strangulata TaxID=200361 RepID=A0A453KPR5_AEGTS